MKKLCLSIIVSILIIIVCGSVTAAPEPPADPEELTTQGNIVSAAGMDSDISVPTGKITISGATLSNGTWYVNSNPITLNITASDNVTATSDLDMYLTNTLLTGSQISEDSIDWIQYQSTYPYTVPSSNTKVFIYLYLRDKAGNISPALSAESVTKYTITFSGEGTNMPASDTCEVGMPFNIPIDEPTPPDGKYFLRLVTCIN